MIEEKIIPINIEEELKSAYIDYSMSVIASRALPDVRDGLKPVHRRVLYGMYMLGMFHNKPYKKSARVVGEVLGKYHPHGDSSVYDTIVRMAQKWILRYKLIDGQGNFGSIDNDPPAAMRYTEIRLQKISSELLADIADDTVDMKYNFDDTIKEPVVLPSKIPNLIINGSSGIAVGMATNMPPHNLGETIDAVCAYIDNNNISIEDLINYIKAPDFPTGGIIYGYEGVKQAFLTGKGKIILRSKIHFEKINKHDVIVIDEIPYQVNKEEMINKIIFLVKKNKIRDISDIRDESSREGIRILFYIKSGGRPNIVLNNLFKYSSLETSFHVNNIALVNGKPLCLNIKDLIQYFVHHRHDVIIKKYNFNLNKNLNRLHIIKGMIFAIDNFEYVYKVLKQSSNFKDIFFILHKEHNISNIQCKSIMDMKLQRFTNIERSKIYKEYTYLKQEIKNINNILNNEILRMKVIKDELLDVKYKYADNRLTKIIYNCTNINIEDLIPNRKVLLTISRDGYIKRTSLSEYKCQSRGGKGNRAVVMKENDVIEHLITATNHQYMLFFTKKGLCFWVRVFDIPKYSKIAKGRPIQNIINISRDDQIYSHILINNLNNEDYINNHYLVMITKNGLIKKTSLKYYSKPRKNGVHAIIMNNNDSLLKVCLTNGSYDIVIASYYGKAIRFNENKIRVTSRLSKGVKSIKLSYKKQDQIIGMVCVNNTKDTILVVSENGFGKRSNLHSYRITNRGCCGVKTINITQKTGLLISIQKVDDNDHLMIINQSGIMIRIPVSQLPIIGRATQGVKLINIKSDDKIAAVTKV